MRKVTMTTTCANVVCEMKGRGWMKFNDKLKDGRRSLKVLGWTDEDYADAAKLLTLMGCDVETVAFAGYSFRGGRNYTQTRLHVKEA